MENLCGFHCCSGYSEQSSMALQPPLTSDNMISSIGTLVPAGPAVSNKAVLQEEEEVSNILRARIASHPLFTDFLHAHIDCHKVGAPPEMEQLLDEIRGDSSGVCQISPLLGADPELNDFMETYYNLLVNYKSDLSRPFDEATAFLNDMETQLNSICNGPAASTNIPAPDEISGSSEKDFNREEKEAMECKRINEDRELKDNLLHKYSGYISCLKHEFSKKKKKERLPKEAKQILLAWWNINFKWPYPTEADKVALAECTGLDQKQINNWFINQRKRHWKPTGDMQTAVLDGLYGPLFMSESD